MKKFAIVLVVVLLCCAALSLAACGDKELKDGQIRITIGSKSFIAELDDTTAAKQLEKELPLTVEMTAVNGQYLHANVNRTFSEQAEPSGILNAGDIMLQGNNTLMLYYAFNNYNDSLTRIGKIREQDRTSFAEAVKQAVQNSDKKAVTVKISK